MRLSHDDLARRSFLLAAAAAGVAATLPSAVRAASGLRIGMIPDAGATQVSVGEKEPL